jgi:hypothetical protein
MNIQYQSSKFATYFQYISSPIVICIFLYYVYVIFTGGILSHDELFFVPFLLWASIFVTINLFKLKYIEVRENDILIKSPSGEKILEYKDIEWINQNIFGSNWYILAIRYKDNISGKSKIIIVFPEMYTTRERLTIFGELNITKYIREQIIRVNQSYSISNEPSRWYLTKWIFISLIPFIMVSILLF